MKNHGHYEIGIGMVEIEEDIKVVILWDVDEYVWHQYILYGGLVYDPTTGAYGVDPETYQKELYNKGFTGIERKIPA